MNERDELVEVIRGVDGPATLGGEELAEAILAAGYLKHPKVERDDLRGTLANTICNASNYPPKATPYLLGGDMSEVLDRTADAILAAGYRKPRTITTVEELDALADDSIILDAESVDWRRNGNLNFTPTWQTSLADDFAFKDAIALPATVLWEPR